MAIKLLLGGSPCTYWSIAQTANGRRETTASGLGWELFRNYLIARDKFKPDFFLYENNASAAPAIKAQISAELGVPLQYINSALVSAQQRKRFYAHNFGDIPEPADRGILLKDILETGSAIVDREKAYALKYQAGNARDYLKKHHTQVAFEDIDTGSADVPIRIGEIERDKGESEAKYTSGCQAFRAYSCYGKSTTLMSGGGGAGGKTGLYAIPAANCGERVYSVSDGEIEKDGKYYPINLPDGCYIIRKLTTRECCRLQTMPDDYFTGSGISNTQIYKCLGNGWTAEVIIHLLRHGLRDVPRDEPLEVLSMYDGIATGRYCLERLGFTNVTYTAYEIDKYAIAAAMNRYPDIIRRGDAFGVREDSWKCGL
jgi:DNA (cytosine-5)-methyltransferase 3A